MLFIIYIVILAKTYYFSNKKAITYKISKFQMLATFNSINILLNNQIQIVV